MTLNSEANVVNAQAQASGSSFYAAMRVMPARKREAIFEIYSFCRAVDDIADDGEPRRIQLEKLGKWRDDIEMIFAGAAPGGLEALAAACRDYALRREDFLTVVDGMEMDVLGPIQAPDWATLDLYCDRVASAVGRLCVRVFGVDEASGLDLAHHLGRALQLTNILRDIDEDAAVDRLYLPRESLRGAGVASTNPSLAMRDAALGAACQEVVARARLHYAEAQAIMRRCPRRAVAAPLIMAAAYQTLLGRLVRRGWRQPRARIKIGRWRLLLLLLRNVLG